MKKKENNMKKFALNKLNDYSKIKGGDGTAERKKVVGAGTDPCGNTYQIVATYILGIRVGEDRIVWDAKVAAI